MGKIVLKTNRANPVMHGHPWIYSGAIASIQVEAPGDLVEVFGDKGDFLGVGYHNPNSQIAVRMLVFAFEQGTYFVKSEEDVPGLIARRILKAAECRQRQGLPSAMTDAFRLVNSEGDGLPGINIDMYGRTAVVQFTTLGLKQRQDAVIAGLLALPLEIRPSKIVECPAKYASTEGFSAQNLLLHASEELKEDDWSMVRCQEAGVLWDVELRQSQKTGMFLDQRDNRIMVGKLSSGAKVLDVYSHAGGFALSALKQGASEATCVDSSKKALLQANHNAAINGFEKFSTVESDAFRFLELASPRSYDVVVVDPPPFASSQKDLESALKGYRRLNSLALNVVSSGGILATATCSQLIQSDMLERVVAKAAKDMGRRVSILALHTQPMDHPVPPTFIEGRYLNFMLLSVD